MPALLPDDEAERLAVLYEHRLLDTQPEEEYDDLVRLVAHVCNTPIAAVTLVDEHRQWFKASVGLDIDQTPRDAAFCAHTILRPDLMVVTDAQKDVRFQDSSLVTGDPHIRFYAGMPLVTEDGHALGSLCVIDHTPRVLTPEQEQTLRLLARQVSSQLRAARRMAEHARLIAEKEHLAAIVEHSQDAIYSKMLDGTITSWNQGAEKLYGYSAAEMVGQKVDLLVPPERRDELAHIMTAVRRGERIAVLETVRVTKAGQRVDVSLQVSSVQDANGDAAGAFMIARNITERRRAEAALEAEREFTRALLESLQEGIVACDDRGTLTLFNRASREFHGLPEQPLPPEQTLPEQWAEHFDLFQADGLTPMHTQDIPLFRALHGETVQDAEMVIAPKSGPTRTLLANGRAILDVTGQKLGAVVAMHDVTERNRMEEALRERAERLRQSEAHLRALLESAPVILYAADAAGIVTRSEGAGLAALGLRPGEVVGRSVFDFSGGDPEIEMLTRRALAGEAVSIDTQLYGLCLHTELRPMRDEDGAITGINGVCFDMTERALAEERFRVLFDQSSDAHLLCRPSGIIDCNNATLALLRCEDKAQIIGLHPSLLSPEFQPDGARSDTAGREREAQAHEHGSHRFEWTHRRLNDEEFPAEVWLTPVILTDGPATLAVLHDLTERKRAEEQIRDHAVLLEFQKEQLEKANAELAALATTDGLTGLCNHRAFQERLAEEVSRSVRYGSPLSLILLDVDRFKQYNDTFGHPQGDEVLHQVAVLLKTTARESDLTARYGGEEFALILPQTDLECAAALAERLRVAVERHRWPVRSVTASFGVAALCRDSEDGAALVARADAAMYRSKQSGRNRVTCAETGNAQPETSMPEAGRHESLSFG